MIVYQLHETNDEWGDYIIGSYLEKEKAKEEKLKKEVEEKEIREQVSKCENCPYIFNENFSEDLNYCSKVQLHKNSHDEVDCLNYLDHWWHSYYYIEEVEVDE